MTAALHLDVARALESALATDGDQLNFAPALDSIRRSMELHSVFLFTCPDATERDRFEIHSISPEKSTPFSNMRLEAEASEFIKSFSDQVVLDWTPLNRFVFRRDPIWELFWQSMVLGPYAGPWEISAVVLRRRPHSDFAGLLVLIRDERIPESNRLALDPGFADSMKLFANQFYTADRLWFTQQALAEERSAAGEALFSRMLARVRGDFVHGVFAKLQMIGLLISNAEDELKKSNRPPVEMALNDINGVKTDIQHLVKDVLSQGGTELKGRPLKPSEWVNVESSIQVVLKSLAPLMRMSSKLPVIRVEETLVFPMHKKDFDEVLENLVHNAIKYSGDSEKIKMNLSHSARKSMLDVTSIGIVIPKSDWERIFERGYRTKEAAAVTMAALGVGLYQARRLVQAAGAQLFVFGSDALPGHSIRIEGRTFPAYRNKFRLLATR